MKKKQRLEITALIRNVLSEDEKDKGAEEKKYSFNGVEYTYSEVLAMVNKGWWTHNTALRVLGFSEVEDGPDDNAEEKKETPLNTRAEILQKAEELINGDRAQTYGPPEISFGRIADIWSAMGYRKMSPFPGETHSDGPVYKAETLTDVDAALLLIGMKLARTVGGPEQMDNWIDLAGYAGLGAELATPRPEESAAEDDGETLIIKFSHDLGIYVCPVDGYLLGIVDLPGYANSNLVRHAREWHPKVVQLMKDNNDGVGPQPVAVMRVEDDE